MSVERMRAAFFARDARCDGRFVTGVTTTGIYCVASCRAKKPRVENLRFFLDVEAAREAGFRACLVCRPDAVCAGRDLEAERIGAIVAAMARSPGALAGVTDVAKQFDCGVTRLEKLFREHRHETVARALRRARIAAACRLLERTSRSLLAIGAEVGWESASAFHAAFRRATGSSPDAYRRSLGEGGFELAIPRDLRVDALLDYLARDPDSPSEMRDGRVFTQVLDAAPTQDGTTTFDGSAAPFALQLDLSTTGRARCTVTGSTQPGPARMARAHATARRLLGLDADLLGLARRAAALTPTPHWATAYPGLRLPLTPTLFDAVVLAIVGQQVHVRFALELRAELIRLCGEPLSGGRHALPTPARVAELDPDELGRRRFSRQKALALVDVARAIAGGELDLAALAAGSARAATARLCAQRGLGPWSASYVLMRGFGFADCTPQSDVGLALALQRAEQRTERPSPAEVAAALAPLSPHRSHACFQLWQSLREEP